MNLHQSGSQASQLGNWHTQNKILLIKKEIQRVGGCAQLTQDKINKREEENKKELRESEIGQSQTIYKKYIF